MTTKVCFDCGALLSWTGSGPEWMNREQWDASKAGDYFAKCADAHHPNGNCYFWDTPTVTALKRVGQQTAFKTAEGEPC